ncbi:MAG: hypothetical protein RPU91_07845 [Candidatus Sedimenticola sp. (ex Thyasira tokunagai)]
MKNLLILIMAAIFLAGCAGKLDYRSPSNTYSVSNTITVDMSRNEVWKRIIPSLGSSFFVINNLDKDSGFINLSYSGDPEKYIDCGYIESYVKNARGERRYNFPAATAYKEYETFHDGIHLLFTKRKMDLEGRINIVVQDTGKESALVTVNTKYVVTKSITISDVQGRSQNLKDSISFNTNGSASFPQPTTCYATGDLETEVLKALNI